MHTRIILFFLLIILSAFFYLYTVNPVDVSFYITDEWTFVLPVTVLVFVGFATGVVLTALNSLFADTVRAIKDMKLKRAKKALLQSEENFRDGVSASFKGDYAAGVKLLEKSLSLNPSNRAALLRLAEAHVAQGNYDEAILLMERELVKYPSDVGLLFTLAECVLKAKDEHKALGIFDSILRTDSGNRRALVSLRGIYTAKKEWEKALDIQEKVSERAKRGEDLKREKRLQASFVYELALDDFNKERFEEARKRIKDALRLSSDFVPALVLKGRVKQALGDKSSAIKNWQRAYEKTNDPILLLELEEMYLSDSSPDRAITLYRDALGSRPNDISLKLLIARLYLRLEMVDDAISVLESMGCEAYSPYGNTLLAESYLRRNQSEKAASHFKYALRLGYELTPAFSCLACGAEARDAAWHGRCRGCGAWGESGLKPELFLSKAGRDAGLHDKDAQGE
jgi:lipopolysaccharide biosynthesis regulator YciM